MYRALRLGIFIFVTMLILAKGIFLIGRKRFLFSSTYRLTANFQNVAGLSEQGWNVDGRERVGAGDDQNVSGLHSGERLAGPQHRQRAFQAA